MKKLKHTLGPWIAQYDIVDDIFYVDSDKGDIAQVECIQINDAEIDEANAYLIAAAPEMLECLIKSFILLQEIDKRYCSVPMTIENFEQREEIRQVIEKVTGMTIEEVLNVQS